MSRLLLVLVAIVSLVAMSDRTATASTGLKIQPLEYTTQLDKGEKRRGVVDISNPLDEPVGVTTSVQAARQINNDGDLEFYDDEAVSEGVLLDHDRLTLEPRSAYRLVFELDASKLPAGDSVAAVFIQTVEEAGSVSGSARVGTLLFITNGTPSSREASITALDTSWLYSGGEVRGSYRVANTADEQQATGFRPTVTMRLSPFHESVTTTGPLVFAGRERVVNFTIPTSAVGVYKLTVETGDSQQSRWVLLLPAWSALLAVGLLFLAISWRYILRRRK